MLLFHVHVFVKSLMAICFICIMAWLFTALVTGLTKDCLHAQRSRIVIVNKVLTPFTWSFFCCFGIFLLKSLYTNFVTLRLLLVIVTVSLLVCLVFLPKWKSPLVHYSKIFWWRKHVETPKNELFFQFMESYTFFNVKVRSVLTCDRKL